MLDCAGLNMVFCEAEGVENSSMCPLIGSSRGHADPFFLLANQGHWYSFELKCIF